jgi:hypothetical protein
LLYKSIEKTDFQGLPISANARLKARSASLFEGRWMTLPPLRRLVCAAVVLIARKLRLSRLRDLLYQMNNTPAQFGAFDTREGTSKFVPFATCKKSIHVITRRLLLYDRRPI